MSDPVYHPSHYTSGDIECIDAQRAMSTPEELVGHFKNTVMKYNWRLGKKGETHAKALEDAEKALVYQTWLVEVIRNHPEMYGEREKKRIELPNLDAWRSTRLEEELDIGSC